MLFYWDRFWEGIRPLKDETHDKSPAKPLFGAAPTSTQAATQPTASTAFNFGSTTQSAATTQPAQTSLFGATTTTAPASTAPSFGASLFGTTTTAPATTAAPATGLGFGATTTTAPTQTATFSTATTAAAPTATTTQAQTQPTVTLQTLTKNTRYQELPTELRSQLDQLENHIREQRKLMDTIRNSSVYAEIRNVEEEIRESTQAITSLNNTLTMDRNLIMNLKNIVMKELSKADTALRSIEYLVNTGLQPRSYPSVLPDTVTLEYFKNLYKSFEDRIHQYRNTVEELSRVSLTPSVPDASSIVATIYAQNDFLQSVANNVAQLNVQVETFTDEFTRWRKSIGVDAARDTGVGAVPMLPLLDVAKQLKSTNAPAAGGPSTQTSSLFAAPAAGTATGGFGQSTMGTSIFGAPQQQTTTTGSLFGTGTGAGGTSLFGATAKPPTTGFGGGTSLFGPSTGTTSLFGQPTQQTQQAGQSLFGAAPAAGTTSLFGATTTAPISTFNAAGSSLFGATTTTAPSLGFGASAAPTGGSLFGAPQTSAPASAGTSGFGFGMKKNKAGLSISTGFGR